MEKNYLIKLTVALYRVTDLFPEKEPLKYQIREKANKILEGFLSVNPKINPPKKEEIFSNLETLFGYFEIAKAQNWVNEKNIEILKTEYQKLQKLVKVTPQQKLSEQRPRTISRVSSRTSIEKEESSPKKFEGGQEKLSPKERKAKILQLLNYKKSITLSEIKNIFFQVSQRTLRRDMESLIKEGIVKRKRLGQKDVLYTLIK